MGGRPEGPEARAHTSRIRINPPWQGRTGLGDFCWRGDRRERILAFRNVYYIRKLIHYARDSVTKYKNTHTRTWDKLSPGPVGLCPAGGGEEPRGFRGHRPRARGSRGWGARAGPRPTPPHHAQGLPHPQPRASRAVPSCHHYTTPDSASSLRPHRGGPLTRSLRNVPLQSPGEGTRCGHCPGGPGRWRLSRLLDK